ncbi:MAG: hypothetical protein SVV03_05765 [Candidatus Nanohaloarchaea archaeon]|nr:hypothetical protein [Candidatus Nanohaloarchaea archaeon]
MRKGYMHAIEGVISSLLVVIYIGALISSPSPTDWSRTSISKRSGDLMESLSRTGWLDRAVARDSPETLKGISQSIDSGMSYSMQVEGVPPSEASVSLLANRSNIQRTPSFRDTRLGQDDGLPESESVYRSGTILGTDFALSDIREDGKTLYTTVNFDLNGNGNYSDTVGGVIEGPYRFGNILKGCLEEECGPFSVGYINDTLTTYNIGNYGVLTGHERIESGKFNVELSYRAEEFRKEISKSGSDFQKEGGSWTTTHDLNGVELEIEVSDSNSTVYLTVASRRKGPYIEGDRVHLLGEIYRLESVMPFMFNPENRIASDILLAKDVDPEVLDRHNQTLLSFLSDDNAVIEMLDLEGFTHSSFRDSIQPELDLEWKDIPINEGGTSLNSFGEDSAAEETRRQFNNIGIRIPRSRYSSPNQKTRVVGLTIRGEPVEANYSVEREKVRFSIDGDKTEWLGDGDRTALKGNIFRIKQVFPLEMSPMSRYRFSNLQGGKVTGEETIMEVSGWSWDREAGSRNISITDAEESPGVPETDCSRKYRRGGMRFRGEIYNIYATNIPSCNKEVRNYEYINIDLNRNGRFNDTDPDTGARYSREGVYQDDEKVVIDGAEFRVRIAPGSDWVYLERETPEEVPSAVWSSDVYQGNGKVVFTGEKDVGDDIASFIKALFVKTASSKHRFTETTSIGSSASGITYPASVEGETNTPYTVESVWWFK